MSELLDWLEAERDKARQSRDECEREGYKLSMQALEGEVTAFTRVIYHVKGEDQ